MVKKLLMPLVRWLYWKVRAYKDDPLHERVITQAFWEGRSTVDLRVRSQPADAEKRRENMS